MVVDRNGLEILPRSECLRLLESRPVGRLAVTRHALPAILPVNYRLVGEDVVFATGTGSKSLSVDRQQVVAFEVDDFDAATRWGWSVLVVGVLRRIPAGGHQWHEVREWCAEPWVGRHATELVRLGTERLSGRRLVPRGGQLEEHPGALTG